MIRLTNSQRTIAMIGLDDTDHPEVGCTTHAFNELIARISEETPSEVMERRLAVSYTHLTLPTNREV